MKRNRAQMVTASFVLAFVAILFGAGAVCAQTTSFTYQGRLTDGASPANGNYDLQFALFDSLSGGTQIGSTQTLSNVAISGGSLTATLDFGSNAFPGADRFLEIRMRSVGGPSFTTLSPRQQITSTPYAIRALNATNAIQNSTAQQANSSFNISDNGTVGGTIAANTLTAATSNISGNSTVGGTVAANTLTAATSNISGNSTVGGTLAANALTAATLTLSGNGTVSGTLKAQRYNLPNAGSVVPFFGMRDSTHFGLCGADNSGVVIGCLFETDLTNAPNTPPTNNINGATVVDGGLTSVGRFTANGPAQLSNGLTVSGGNTVLGGGNTTLGPGITNVNGPANFFSGIVVNGPQQLVSNAQIAVNNLGPAGSLPLCLNGGNQIASCSSSLRYKKDIGVFIGGLDIIHRLRPISFIWKDHPERDLGFAAEEVATVEPRLVTHNSKGEIEGVKYDRLTAVVVNAIKQQQTQIEQQQAQIQSLKKLVCRNHRNASACK